MPGVIFASVMSFIGTNLDNIFLLMLFFTQAQGNFKRGYVVAGQYIGMGFLVLISLLGAFGLNLLPQEYIGLLGLLPIAIATKEWLGHKKVSRDNDDEPEEKPTENKVLKGIKSISARIIRPEILSITLITIANGGDNISIYIPLFSTYSLPQIIAAVLVFAGMTAVWCWLGYKITALPRVSSVIKKYKHIAVPVVLIGLGVFIVIDSGVIAQFAANFA